MPVRRGRCPSWHHEKSDRDTPMRYKIVHTTTYTYSDAVPICHNEVHLIPRDAARQACLYNRLRIKPRPTVLEQRVDYFGNRVTNFAIEQAHQKLTVVALSRVHVTAAPPAHRSGSIGRLGRHSRRLGLVLRPGRSLSVRVRFDPGELIAGAARLCLGQFSTPAADRRRRARFVPTHLPRFHLRPESHHRQHAAASGARAAPRRLPGFCPSGDRLPPLAGTGRPLRQRLSADPAARRANLAWSGRTPRMPG